LAVQVFAVFQAGNLGKRVCLIGLFKRGCEQAVLAHRLRCETRIDARRAEEEEFLASVSPCGIDDVHLQHHVVVHEVGQCGFVGYDAADLGCGEEDVFRAFCGEEVVDRLLVDKVKFGMVTSDYVGVTLT
jgi:hypothetical protein